MERDLLLSRIKTPDGTILESRYVHDYVSHVDNKSGETYFLDGGNSYVRTSVNKEKAENVSIYSDSDYDEIRDNVVRFALDKNGNRIVKKLKEMSNAHLWNCITYNVENGFPVDDSMNIVYMREIVYRHYHGISIEDDFQQENGK